MAVKIPSISDPLNADVGVVNVECHITQGLPAIIIIGYASKAVDEAKERLRASFSNSNIPFPKKRLTINLSPADIPKDTTSLDLAMAVSVMAQDKQIIADKLKDWMFFGELGLDGALLPVRGLIGRLITAKKKGYDKFYIPNQSLVQAKLVPDIEIKAAPSLRDVFLDLSGVIKLPSINSGIGVIESRVRSNQLVDFVEINGQDIAKRALEIAAAGHHNILMHGPPGTGKTMLAKAFCGILPDLKHSEVLEVTHLHSLGNEISETITERPFRSPHHTASVVAIVGGGTKPKPGEASLAHKGVLFLDEIPEYSRAALEALRQPLEDRVITVSRIKDTVTYPADFILIGTQNPCPCGYYGTDKPCICTASALAKYQKKLSGPVLDRIDLHISVNNINHKDILSSENRPLQSPFIKKRVERAFDRQIERFGEVRFNSSMSNKEIRSSSSLSNEAKELLDKAAESLKLSARVYVRTVKVARTIADLDGSKDILPAHIGEALQYRQMVYA